MYCKFKVYYQIVEKVEWSRKSNDSHNLNTVWKPTISRN